MYFFIQSLIAAVLVDICANYAVSPDDAYDTQSALKNANRHTITDNIHSRLLATQTVCTAMHSLDKHLKVTHGCLVEGAMRFLAEDHFNLCPSLS
jgi:hypothetical protein